MSDRRTLPALPPLPGLVAGALVVVGVALWMFVSKGLLFVAALGAFGPGLLRELGLLKDHDEFQRQAAHRAGYHAYLVGGFAAAFLASALAWPGSNVEASSEWVPFLLVVLWLAWLFSSLLSYWGAPRTASTVLCTFGSFWAVFVIASLASESGAGVSWGQTLLAGAFGLALVGAFFVPAWTAHRWPRATGLALLLATVALLVVLGGRGGLSWSTKVMTDTLLFGPLVVSALALLLARASTDEDPPACPGADRLGTRHDAPPEVT